MEVDTETEAETETETDTKTNKKRDQPRLKKGRQTKMLEIILIGFIIEIAVIVLSA